MQHFQHKKRTLIFGDISTKCQQTLLLNNLHDSTIALTWCNVSNTLLQFLPILRLLSFLWLLPVSCLLSFFTRIQPIELNQYNANFFLWLFLLRTIQLLYTYINMYSGLLAFILIFFTIHG